ncbi:hypothetical protein GCM10025331_80220 [Actinoplanes utahensis]|nr:hypothetical protein Aut01nite_69000 [Actinoplanes utahensis]
MKDRLKGDSTVTENLDSLAGHAGHDEKMAGRDGVQVHEGDNGLVLEHHARLAPARRDAAENALPCHAPRRRRSRRPERGHAVPHYARVKGAADGGSAK